MKTIPLRQAQNSNACHPHFFAAVLSSATAAQVNAVRANGEKSETQEWQIPVIEFTTDEATRRSMTLNGMRMATEFFAHDSPRVLTLVEQRLQAGQRDVVHDVLIYLWERVLLMRANVQEAKNLQAESLAAYLGLEPKRAGALLEESPLDASRIAQRIENGEAGRVRRKLNVFALTENLLARLQPELKEFKDNEDRILFLIEKITAQLYADNT